MIEEETAGDPMSDAKWTRTTLSKISELLKEQDINVCPNTVKKLLQNMGYSLKINYKRFESDPKKATPISIKERDQQFKYIKQVRKEFNNREDSIVISVDSKKKELIGNFYNKGRTWCKAPAQVNAYDFLTLAEGKFNPYGIYDLKHNRGLVVGGISSDTSEFAVNSIERWLRSQPNKANIKSLLILADGGGSNGSSNKMWKYGIQKKICEKYNIEVTVCHYPPGTSKFNPIEHHMFSELSKNWAGQPLKTYGTALNFIRGTTAKNGLDIKAEIDMRNYETGIKITDQQWAEINLWPHNTIPKLNYTIRPNLNRKLFLHGP
ncbi:ISAzo13 family transposase [Arachidicoccus ginsenosidivorans]|uniref:ISAzo13 family transposase n=1 Tax=Arachidicoccus ginsenosidivorans TaxID=496057 RepID=UPI0013157043|nr:ISAzo13 family transposase [Arachidicoccus ginsenosidivorans]